MNVYKISGVIEDNQKGIDEYTLWEYKSSLELIANQAINLSEPENIKQARDNLSGLARLVLSSCAKHGIDVK